MRMTPRSHQRRAASRSAHSKHLAASQPLASLIEVRLDDTTYLLTYLLTGLPKEARLEDTTIDSLPTAD